VFPINIDEMGNIGPRLAAGFNSLANSNHPDGEVVGNYSTEAAANHYSRILHEINADRSVYAFQYDDVGASGGRDQSGSVSDGSPELLTVAVGESG
jgi:hypothetical protein